MSTRENIRLVARAPYSLRETLLTTVASTTLTIL